MARKLSIEVKDPGPGKPVFWLQVFIDGKWQKPQEIEMTAAKAAMRQRKDPLAPPLLEAMVTAQAGIDAERSRADKERRRRHHNQRYSPEEQKEIVAEFLRLRAEEGITELEFATRKGITDRTFRRYLREQETSV